MQDTPCRMESRLPTFQRHPFLSAHPAKANGADNQRRTKRDLRCNRPGSARSVLHLVPRILSFEMQSLLTPESLTGQAIFAEEDFGHQRIFARPKNA